MRVVEMVSVAAGTAAVVYMAGHLMLAERPRAPLRGTIAPDVVQEPPRFQPSKLENRVAPVAPAVTPPVPTPHATA